MTQYTIGYDAASQEATILLPGHELPKGAADVGVLDISSVGPNPTDLSTQHITTMLQRKGFTDLDHLTVRVSREPVKDVIEQDEMNPGSSNGEGLENAVLPKTLSLTVGSKHDLVEGSTTGFKFATSDDSVVKVGRGGNLTALKAGSATVTVTNKAGLANDVVITVAEAAPSTGATEQQDAKEAEAA